MENVLVFSAVVSIVLILVMVAIGKLGALIQWNVKVTLLLELITLITGIVIISRRAGWF